MFSKLRNFFSQPMSATRYILLVTVFNMGAYHFPLFSFTLENITLFSLNGILTLFSVIVGLFVVTAFLLFLFAFISVRLIRAFTLVMLVGNSVALYFIVSYQVILDRSMIGNVFNTNTAEALSYYHPKLFVYLFFIGILPAYAVSKLHIQKADRLRLLKHAFAILAGGVLLMYLNGSTWLWIDKYAKRLGGLSLPWSYTINAIRYKSQEMEHSKTTRLLPAAKFSDDSKRIVILVIGESARADNFSLYGYGRQTNPELKKLNIVALKNTFSTTTYTTASVHSMLSYEGGTSDDYEPLPNYLQRTGADVIWRSKNWGEPVLKVESFEKDDTLKQRCKGERCDFDEVLLTGLAERIASSKKNKIFIVLHTSGSHGPTYYTKYPPRYEIFKPVCKTVALKECSEQELINAYDNSVVYTDYFLSRVIGILKQFSNVPSTMLYISDHGESLGEYGLYLHGTPYSIAPEVQKKIPFIIWESEAFLKEKNQSAVSVKTEDHYGQNHIFHSVLGALGVRSPVYNEKLDLYSDRQ